MRRHTGTSSPTSTSSGRSTNTPSTVDLEDWADLFAAAGAAYVVMVTRHLDGYPLWPTAVANPHMPRGYRSGRDLVGGLADAVRARGLKMGAVLRRRHRLDVHPAPGADHA